MDPGRLRRRDPVERGIFAPLKSIEMTPPAHSLTAIVLLIALSLGACKKEESAVPAQTPSTPSNNGGSGSSTPMFDDMNGMLWAINTITSQNVGGAVFEIESGMGIALFPNADNSANVSAGTVKLNDVELTLNSDNSYLSLPSQTNPMGIDLSSGATHWTGTGANGIPAIDHTPNFSFPTVGDITSSTTVDISSGYTLEVASITASDSVVFMVGNVVKTKASGTTSCSFSAQELAGASAGASIIQVSPYSYSSEVIGGKTMYFGKQTARTSTATIQ